MLNLPTWMLNLGYVSSFRDPKYIADTLYCSATCVYIRSIVRNYLVVFSISTRI